MSDKSFIDEHGFRTLMDTISLGIVAVDLDWTITFANAAYHRILEYPPTTLIGKCVWDILKPDPRESRNFFERLLVEQPAPGSFFSRRLTLSGKYVDVKVDWNYIRDKDKKIAGFVVAVTDVTQQRRAEEEAQDRLNQLAHISRVLMMEKMISGLAHELNQPLSAISNYAQACAHHIRESDSKC
ncbi:MAG: PAS domain S-box protein, partial [Thermoguttaceae bacterium]